MIEIEPEDLAEVLKQNPLAFEQAKAAAVLRTILALEAGREDHEARLKELEHKMARLPAHIYRRLRTHL